MAFFHQTAADSAFYQRALRLPGLGARDHLARPEPHHIMQLPARIENLYEGLSAGLRKQLRRDRKKLSEKYPGKIRIHCFRHSADIGEAARDMEEVARKTYQRGLGVGFADNMGMRTRLQLFSQKGWLRAWVLYLNDVPCSFWTGTVYNGVLYLDYIAYDPALREYSPGTLLMMKALEDLCSEGVGAVDFGFGQADYKQRFGNVRLMESSIYIYAPSLKGLLLNAMRTAPILIDRVSKTILSRTKLLPKVKKLWRKRVTNP
jgi:hypothetical protein